MEDAFKRHLRGFLKKYHVSLEGIDFGNVCNFDSMWKELGNSDIDFGRIPYDEFSVHLRYIFYLQENGINLGDLNKRLADNERLSFANYIEHSLRSEYSEEAIYAYDSKYAMGNPYKFDEGECSKEDLAYEILTKIKQNTKYQNIEAEISSKINSIYRKGGLVDRLKKDLGLDFDQFTGEDYEIEKCKIIYFFKDLKNRYFPILQGKKEEASNVLKFIRNLSLENSDFVRLGYQPKNAELVRFIKGSLENELRINRITYIKDTVEQIEVAWNDYLDAVVFTIDNSNNSDFKSGVRLSESVLHKTHKTIEGNNHELSPIETLYLKFIQFERLGEMKDIMSINDNSPEINDTKLAEFIWKMQLWANMSIHVDYVGEFIDEKTAEIAELVYLNREIVEDELNSIQQNKKDVIRILEYCLCVKPSLIYNQCIPKLRIVSCLQAILLDTKKEKTKYKYYNYQSTSSHPPKIEDMPEDDEKTIIVQTRYRVRKMIDHWYANIGKSELRDKLRELENKCCEIQTKIFSCSSVSEMVSVHNNYYGQRYEMIDSIFK